MNPGEFRVTIVDPGQDIDQWFRDVCMDYMQLLADALQLNITLYNTHCIPSLWDEHSNIFAQATGTELKIFFCANIDGLNNCKYYDFRRNKVLYGTTLTQGLKDGCSASPANPLDAQIIRTQAFEYLTSKKVLCIYNDLTHQPNNNTEKEACNTVMIALLKDFVMKTQSPAAIDRFNGSFGRIEELKTQRHIDALAKVVGKELGKEIENKISDLRNLRSDLERLKTNLIEKARREATLAREITLYETATFEDKAKRMLQKIFAHPKVKGCELDSRNNIIIFTDVLYGTVVFSRSHTRRYRLGEYKLIMDIKRNNLKINRPEGRINGRYHPHAHDDGNMCFGNISDAIVNYFSERAYDVIVDLMLSYLESINPFDAYGVKVRHWPEVDENNNPISRTPEERDEPFNLARYG